MNLKPEELTKHGFVMIHTMKHEELMPFLKSALGKKTKFTTIYYASLIIFFILTVYFFVAGFGSPDYSFLSRLLYLFIGLAGAFALIPLHEFVHVLAYKSQGAQNTSYDADFRRFHFLALADRFVADRKEFRVIALAPFIVITAVLAGLLFAANPDWDVTLSAAMLMHTVFCSGDLALMGYFEFNKEKNTVTYDDVANKTSYFYGKKQ